MTDPLFRQVGPYAIRRQIGRGGMAMVFLADDTRDQRTVALKVLPAGPDDDTREIAEAERRGAELQRQFLSRSRFVPAIYEVDESAGYLYIAMEYLDGEDLAAIIRRGPVESERAARIAIQLCQFLKEIDHLAVGDASALTLLHNDLKPTNIRLVAGDAVKVLDFGAAKALSMSRRVTRNDFYSTPYLSPECLDTGERDRQTDAWALGVILYETVAGVPPFRANDTRRLEDRIRSRRPPAPLPDCPVGLQAVVAKLLAPEAADRYESADGIREDLERLVAGTGTHAEKEGWPERRRGQAPAHLAEAPSVAREPRSGGGGGATAPLAEAASVASAPRFAGGGGGAPPPLNEDEPPTRKAATSVGPSAPGMAAGLKPGGSVLNEDEPPTRKVPRIVAQDVPVSPSAAVAVPAVAPRKRRTWLRAAVVAGVLTVVGNEACVFREARTAAAAVPMQELTGLDAAWDQFEALRHRSYLGVGAHDLGLVLKRQSVILADRVAANYRTPAPTVRETQWMAAARALERALAVVPDDSEVRGTLRYAQGHLSRIDGEADKSRKQAASAQRNFSEAVTAFREAASLRRDWPDPFLGLARTFIYGLEDIDRGVDAMNQAQKLGHVISPRETAQLADGYASRSEALNRAASEVRGMPQEREFLTRAREACQKALGFYATIPDYTDVPSHIRMTQRRLEVVDRKLAELDGQPQIAPAETGSGRVVVPLGDKVSVELRWP